MKATHLSLFSGIGGLDLAATWAGFHTVQFVEQNAFCQKVLAKHFPGVPIHDDIRTFDGKPFRGRISLLSGGFPCQDISIAGRQEGLEGHRSKLWFEMLRVIGEVRLAWICAENVANIVNMGIDVCLAGLEAEGYAAREVIFPAIAVGACHHRPRCFIIATNLANPKDDGLRPLNGLRGRNAKKVSGPANRDTHGDQSSVAKAKGEQDRGLQFARLPANVATSTQPSPSNSSSGRCEGESRRGPDQKPSHRYAPLQSGRWSTWDVEPLIRRGHDGISRGLDRRGLKALRKKDRSRLMALGNAVCPQQAYPVMAAIAQELANA